MPPVTSDKFYEDFETDFCLVISSFHAFVTENAFALGAERKKFSELLVGLERDGFRLQSSAPVQSSVSAEEGCIRHTFVRSENPIVT